jgi:transcriptional regulator with XRE-family HTH domain
MVAEAESVAVHFGRNLRLHRRRAGLSQEGLGERADLHRTAIGLLERGKRVPRIDTVVKLASTLSIRPGELLDGIEWSPDSDQPGGFELRPSDEAGKA